MVSLLPASEPKTPAVARQPVLATLAALPAEDFRLRTAFRASPAFAATVSPRALAALEAHPGVDRVDLDVGGTGGLDETVPLISADVLHEQGVRGEGVVVAVLDTGIDQASPDLADALVHEECFLNFGGEIDGFGRCPNGGDRQSGPGASTSLLDHGIGVSGIVASRGRTAPLGVAPGADIVSVKVLDDTPPAGRFFNLSEVTAALEWILLERPEVRVVNLSLMTGAHYQHPCDEATAGNQALAAVVERLRARGTVVVSISGNQGVTDADTGIPAPGCIEGVVTVGATSKQDFVANFSNSVPGVDLLAPGSGIRTSGRNGAVITGGGTSFAAPHAAGCAALWFSNGLSTAASVEDRLRTSPYRIEDPRNGLVLPRLLCGPERIATVSGASFRGPVAPGSIASSFFSDFLVETAAAAAVPLPETLNGLAVEITDASGVLHRAGLFFVSKSQANLLLPPNLALGPAGVRALLDGEPIAEGRVDVFPLAPGVFSRGEGGREHPAAILLRVAPDGSRTETVLETSDALPPRIEFGPEGEQLYLLLFGTGMRSPLAVADSFVGRLPTPVLGPVAHPVFAGLDQVNLGPLPRELAGIGVARIELILDGLRVDQNLFIFFPPEGGLPPSVPAANPVQSRAR